MFGMEHDGKVPEVLGLLETGCKDMEGFIESVLQGSIIESFAALIFLVTEQDGIERLFFADSVNLDCIRIIGIVFLSCCDKEVMSELCKMDIMGIPYDSDMFHGCEPVFWC